MRRGTTTGWNIVTGPQHDHDGTTTGTEDVVSGALFDFMGRLTSGDQEFVLGGHHTPYELLDAFSDWAVERGLDTHNADVYNWQDRLARELVRVARILATKKELSEEEKAAQQKRREKKVKGVRTLAENITSLRNRVTRDLKSDNEKIRIKALAVALMDRTAERVGNEESAASGHVGVTGFKKKHITIDGNKITFSYVGKSGVKHEKSFSDKLISKLLKELLESCSPDDFVLRSKDGFKVKADAVNRYLAEYNITAKDIRGYKANDYMVEKLRRLDAQMEEKDRKKSFLEALRSVSEMVGHGAQTLRTHYLLPNLENDWVKNGNVVDLKTASFDVKKVARELVRVACLLSR